MKRPDRESTLAQTPELSIGGGGTLPFKLWPLLSVPTGHLDNIEYTVK